MVKNDILQANQKCTNSSKDITAIIPTFCRALHSLSVSMPRALYFYPLKSTLPVWAFASLLNSFVCPVNRTQNSGFTFQCPFSHWLLVPQAEIGTCSSGFAQHHCFPATPLCGWFPGGLEGKNLPAIQETQVQSLSWDDPVEKGMVTHSTLSLVFSLFKALCPSLSKLWAS